MVSARFLPLLFLWALACDEPVLEGAEQAPVAAQPAGWAERFSLVRGDLAQLEKAHTDKDRDAAVASWEQAYRQRFEPLIEQPVGDRVDLHAVLAVEYAFGQLRDGLESPRPGPVKAALVRLREDLDTLEPLVSALPPPQR
jgi:hypothetical protein